MSKHTPGPWGVGDTDPLLIEVKQGNGTCPLGFVYGPSFPEQSALGSEALANARLIAAAPDLLEALQAILPWIPKTSAKEGGASAHSGNVRAADMVRAAIAKATGEGA